VAPQAAAFDKLPSAERRQPDHEVVIGCARWLVEIGTAFHFRQPTSNRRSWLTDILRYLHDLAPRYGGELSTFPTSTPVEYVSDAVVVVADSDRPKARGTAFSAADPNRAVETCCCISTLMLITR
jgi:hypothetical protein